MEAPAAQPSTGKLRGIAVIVLLVVGVGLLARPVPSPAPSPSPTDAAAPTPTADRSGRSDDARAGSWATIPEQAPIDLLRSRPAVWNGRELIVGFSPRVAAFSPDRPAPEAWRSLPPHPAEPLQVRGATHVRGGAIYVYGTKACAGCPWEPTLHALDPASATWEQRSAAPGPASQDREAVVSVANQLIVVRDRGGAGLDALAYDPRQDQWRRLQLPVRRAQGWQAIAAGDRLLIAGLFDSSGDVGRPGVMLYDVGTDRWADVARGMPLSDPHEAAAVWTGDAVVFFGSGIRDGAERGASLSLVTRRWTPLPPLPADDPALPTLSDLQGPLSGVSGLWDGDRAVFVGGLSAPVFVAWSPDEADWQVRWSTGGRAGATAVWTGQQVLLWGGVDRRGPALDLQVWPADPTSE